MQISLPSLQQACSSNHFHLFHTPYAIRHIIVSHFLFAFHTSSPEKSWIKSRTGTSIAQYKSDWDILTSTVLVPWMITFQRLYVDSKENGLLKYCLVLKLHMINIPSRSTYILLMTCLLAETCYACDELSVFWEFRKRKS